jgi:hypothetical protein
MDNSLRDLVRRRASNYCEYCRIHQDADPLFRFHVEHIIPRQHSGADDEDNLALACGHCNRRKGPNLSAVDPLTGSVTLLFNPRRQEWNEHFVLNEGVVAGTSASGRATVRLFQMNEARRIQLRNDF